MLVSRRPYVIHAPRVSLQPLTAVKGSVSTLPFTPSRAHLGHLTTYTPHLLRTLMIDSLVNSSSSTSAANFDYLIVSSFCAYKASSICTREL